MIVFTAPGKAVSVPPPSVFVAQGSTPQMRQTSQEGVNMARIWYRLVETLFFEIAPRAFVIALCWALVSAAAVAFGPEPLRQAGYKFGAWGAIALAVTFPPFIAAFVWAVRRHLRAKREKIRK